MALSKIHQRRSGGSGSTGGRLNVSKKNNPKHQQQQQQRPGGRSLASLPLTKKRGQGGARSTGYGKRQSNGSQQHRANARGVTSASAAVSARASSSNGPPGGKSKPPDAKLPQSNKEHRKAVNEGAKVVEELRSEMVGAAQSVVDKAEAECEAMLAAALEGCAVLTAGRERYEEAGQIAMREMESRRASTASRCSGMLREIEANRNTLSEMAKRFSTALDGVVQAESRKIKISLDRVTGEKS